MMRDAILKAADHIERSPNAFNFQQGCVPRSFKYLGFNSACALAWIGHFSDSTGVRTHNEVARYLLGRSSSEFYQELSSLLKENSNPSWIYSTVNCVKALRLYADKYFPAKHEGLPESVKEIFAVKEFEAQFVEI